MKYIILDNAMEEPILFFASREHSDVARGRKCISAGFCKIFADNDKIEVAVRGKSISLNLESRPEDADIIKRIINFEEL